MAVKKKKKENVQSPSKYFLWIESLEMKASLLWNNEPAILLVVQMGFICIRKIQAYYF